MPTHSTCGLDGNHIARREILTVARQHVADVLATTSTPTTNYERMLAEVLKLKPQKRKNWTGVLANTSGQQTIVRYDEAGIEVPMHNCVAL